MWILTVTDRSQIRMRLPWEERSNPEIVYGFGATARYKQVDFNVFFQGNGKTHRFIGGVASNFLPGSSQGAMGNVLTNYNDRWTPENPSEDVFYPRLSYGANT